MENRTIKKTFKTWITVLTENRGARQRYAI